MPESANEVARPLPLPLATERLTLRRFTPHDWKEMSELAADDDFLIYANLAVRSDDESVREEAVIRWLEADGVTRLTTPDTPFHLAIELQDGGKLTGFLRTHFTDRERLQANLCLNLHRKYQRMGFGFEAATAFIRFCFEDLRLHRLTASCDGGNAAACALCEKLGMRCEAEFVKDHSYGGQWRNTVWYAVLAEECCEPADSRVK